MDRKQETKIVKTALKNAGHNNCQVKHGTGTAWGWLSVYSSTNHSPDCNCTKHSYGVQETCQKCGEWWRKKHNAILETVLKATGRNGGYDGRVNIHLNFNQEQYNALPVVD